MSHRVPTKAQECCSLKEFGLEATEILLRTSVGLSVERGECADREKPPEQVEEVTAVGKRR